MEVNLQYIQRENRGPEPKAERTEFGLEMKENESFVSAFFFTLLSANYKLVTLAS
jgi:hypothetical protein